MIIKSRYLVPKNHRAITFFPFIFIKKKEFASDAVLINHEKIHIRQQLELLVIPFYVLYGFEFMILLMIKRNWDTAYRSISFEKEAYENENNLNYLNNRSFYNNFSYFARKKSK